MSDLFESSDLDKRTVALELAYQHKYGFELGRIKEGFGSISESTKETLRDGCREWAEQNHMDFEDEAERLLTKLESPL